MDLSLGVSLTSVPTCCCGSGSDLPPSGFVFVTDDDEARLQDDDGNFLIEEI
ncbi:hypothetical protein V5F59_20565 [Xanthobacter autotrophicus DSM 431]|uniref:hypothetical protein n=1 Tax=Xanthobacter nonsaccharivorans TaxID=3119912 RepID=UPI0037297AC3